MHLTATQLRNRARLHPTSITDRGIVHLTPEERPRAFGQARVVVAHGPVEVRVEPVGELLEDRVRAAEARGEADV